MNNNLLPFNEGGSSGNVVQIEDNNYTFNVFLWNGDAKTGITFSAINELKIVDDLRYFYSYGYMTFNDTKDILETYNGPNGDGSVIPYTFRGDGRDYLQIEIMPQLKPNDVFIQSVSEQEKKEFCLKYTFSIYKIEEEKLENSISKSKRLYFWDVDYQLLNEITANFSSSEVTLKNNNGIGGSISQFSKNNSNNSQKIKNTDDYKRYSGDIIKNLLDKSLNKITKTGFKASKDWDRGGALIEYHTNGKYKAIDDLQYLLQYHVSDEAYDYVPCILKKIRYSDEYSLIPITAYTLNNNTSEEFTLGELDADNKGNASVGNIKKFQASQSPYSFNAINFNIIENYSFIKPEADMIQNDVSTHFVHSYDPNGFFTCSIKSNNFGNSKKSIFQNNNAATTTNTLREENNNAQHVYAAGLGIGQNFQKLNFGRNKGLMASVFKNTAIYFKIRGLTRRRSGTYFSVDRNDSQAISDHDVDVLGKYFTTLVIHEFNGGKYYNHIYGTKSDGVKHNAKMV